MLEVTQLAAVTLCCDGGSQEFRLDVALCEQSPQAVEVSAISNRSSRQYLETKTVKT